MARPARRAVRTREADMPTEHEKEHVFWRLLTVFSVSSAMVGVCLTAIGLLSVLKRIGAIETLCDALLVGDAVLFLISAGLSFLALRRRFEQRWHHFLFVVDSVFFLGIVLMIVVCALITWAVV
jgi:hypothetical protein